MLCKSEPLTQCYFIIHICIPIKKFKVSISFLVCLVDKTSLKPSISPLLFIFSDDSFLMVYYDMISCKPFILILIAQEGKYKRVGQCLVELFSVLSVHIFLSFKETSKWRPGSSSTHYEILVCTVQQIEFLGICDLVTKHPKHFIPAGSYGSVAGEGHTHNLATPKNWPS